ncbi:DNA recombination protein RmuC [Prevotella sp. tf2-5]|uniref:DNA recombination protein RmuC n=1 Tax=Prevotella sp. tf2-5 TaxID=1761889 RepID=UPI0008E1F250|nr:DNA recombination protein RmuC [Prevotella sp. tf2-5]SFO62522.1 DNA recombination protein RmuC [Prevotella sp. tf2-5]
MIALYIVIGIVVGAVVLYLVMNQKVGRLHVELAKKETEMQMLSQQRTEELRQSEERFSEQMRSQRELAADQLRAQREQSTEQLRAAREQFDEQLKTTKEQLRVMAQQLMDAQAQRLKEENKENMGTITQPLKDAISEMRKAINENTKDHTEQSASLKEQLRMMMESNREIGEKAESLANVLRRDNKVSGNMGEIILGDLLASQGLTEGIHYEVQARLRDEQGRPLKNDDTGKEMQPDVILHYPQGQDAVIDSKVSLVAYQRYVNAEDPEEKERALQDHIKSIRSHVTELARKDYSKYIKAPREAVDFVIMFVPFESSLQLALANDPTLWREAFERKVFITGEQNLLGILHMIHIAWVQNQQAENQEKVFGIAESLLDRLGDFIQRYNKIGEQLDQAHRAFEAAGNKLFTGRQSVVQKGRELVDLGAKENPNRRIPKAENDLLK